MTFTKQLLAAIVLAASLCANAQVNGTLGGGGGSFLALSSAGLGSGGSVATLSGGSTYLNDMPFADVPAGTVSGAFLAAGVTAGPTATLTFANGGVDYLSFLWGSPDTYNFLTVNTTAGSKTFTTSTLGFSVSNGNQSFSQYVQFAALTGGKITSVSFTNSPNLDAFEAANFSVIAPVTAVPEPESYALLLAGAVAFLITARRRGD
jgi:hypothetical protein